jgi:hypothetical protein
MERRGIPRANQDEGEDASDHDDDRDLGIGCLQAVPTIAQPRGESYGKGVLAVSRGKILVYRE